jgi:endonuclease YncB( thermonuclease family)
MSRGSLAAPGWLRGWWWRSSQLQRLAVSGVATVVGLALSGVALFPPSGKPALFDGATSATESQHRTTTADTSIPVVPSTPEDAVITVTTVSTVARFEGVDSTSGHAVAVHVLGILALAGCWSAESTAQASEALLGRRVWLVHTAGGQPHPEGDVTAQVLLPDHHDYALTMVRAGAARTDTRPDQAALVAAQADSQQARRGLWGSSCAPTPGSGSTTGQTTPSGATATTSPTQSTASAPPTPTTSGTEPPVTTTSGDGRVRVGQPCSPVGATGVTAQGQLVTCVRGAAGNDRWRKS